MCQSSAFYCRNVRKIQEKTYLRRKPLISGIFIRSVSLCFLRILVKHFCLNCRSHFRRMWLDLFRKVCTLKSRGVCWVYPGSLSACTKQIKTSLKFIFTKDKAHPRLWTVGWEGQAEQHWLEICVVGPISYIHIIHTRSGCVSLEYLLFPSLFPCF